MTDRRTDPPRPEETVPNTHDPHVSDLLDEALEDTFPASDPPAMTQPKPKAPAKPERAPATRENGDRPVDKADADDPATISALQGLDAESTA